ncbi:endonuclease/exonuclease/phosphatase family protein [Rhodobium gokarnense]|uniref:Endonuclease/exonuclease/phosphatase (EEP) superfamily protein YafD n=1 Tax=Rhodobium gokarnense TaxID=364296 RepID=A0ABT3HAA4_9HYPH|nr:endonuclease/exonuclease/phosphatase family protein [Rhodobium gokarnense]MCW2307323.1 endonuclease/exonuclease/phosphatase (EEP) superfamily protein YafD [Rhodobium gokarnense]
MHLGLGIAAALCLLASLIPLLPIPHGAVRMFDFARLQILAFSAATLVLAAALLPFDTAAIVIIGAALAAAAIQIVHVIPFTPVWPTQTARYEGADGTADFLSLLVSNVKQSNRDYDKLCAVVAEEKPDIAVFMETDPGWAKGLRPVLDDFAETVECPLDNSYGMIVASRLKLREAGVQHLLNDEVPSISIKAETRGGAPLRLIALHPEPPIPTNDTMGRDAEILVAGRMARKETLPTIVTGDLNDVAWSRTTRRFLRISRLLDPRQGRGTYNSFDARYPLLRWPLDHIFHSREFELVDIRRLPFVGSDHFPMYYRFALVPVDRNDPPEKPSEDDREEARDIIRTEKSRDREPIGTDWET